MEPDQIVRDFCAAWGRADLASIMEAFAEDAIYHNIPMAPCEGKPAIKEFIESFLGSNPKGIDFDIRLQVATGNVVFNERVDTLEVGGREIALPVCGVFEVDDDGKISAWRDYFDMAQFAGG
jgi:limonene-1,2-epoxide hydrolase